MFMPQNSYKNTQKNVFIMQVNYRLKADKQPFHVLQHLKIIKICRWSITVNAHNIKVWQIICVHFFVRFLCFTITISCENKSKRNTTNPKIIFVHRFPALDTLFSKYKSVQLENILINSVGFRLYIYLPTIVIGTIISNTFFHHLLGSMNLTTRIKSRLLMCFHSIQSICGSDC